ncbi:MAG: inositol monophosphatase [Gammaproteobacteria bacterium]|nr:inositol monophosphatase [Gammaproteobacteria bacterium]
MHPNLNIAIRAARRAGDLILRASARVDTVSAELKGRQDFVTKVDRDAEAVIIDTLRTAYPGDAFLGEESGAIGDSERVWIIDPLDGTTNFLHGFPVYAVSIALAERGILQQAVVYDPNRDELFTATRGSGAQLNNRKIRVSGQRKLERALLGTGFPVRDEKLFRNYLGSFNRLSLETSGIRRAGSAAIDLSYVACGRLDGFWEFGLSSWDIAAGVLLIQEAGGIVTTPQGKDDYLATGALVAGNPHLCEAIRNSVATAP